MKAFKKGLGLLGICVVSLMLGCGGASNNDQGASVTFLGYIADADDCEGTTPNSAGGVIPLGTPTEALGATNAVVAGALVQNNLSAQFVRTERIFFDYFIPGASSQPPSTSAAIGQVIAQAGASTDGTAVSGPTGCSETLVVSPEILEWINLNRAALPEAPFTMEVSAYVTVVSSGGDRLDTNEILYPVTFTPDNVIAPTPGDGTTDGDTGGATETTEVDTATDTVDTVTDVGGDL